MKPRPISLQDVRTRFEQDEEFRKADRKIKPYYELVRAMIHRRSELGLTQRSLAERVGTHQSRISKIESAEHDLRLSTLIQIAEALETEVSIRLVPIVKPILLSEDEQARVLFRFADRVSFKPTDNAPDNKSGEQVVTQVYT